MLNSLYELIMCMNGLASASVSACPLFPPLPLILRRCRIVVLGQVFSSAPNMKSWNVLCLFYAVYVDTATHLTFPSCCFSPPLLSSPQAPPPVPVAQVTLQASPSSSRPVWIGLNNDGGWPHTDPQSCDGFFGNGWDTPFDLLPRSAGVFNCTYHSGTATHVCESGVCVRVRACSCVTHPV